MPKMIFINLPVADLERATAFYEAVGARKDERFSDHTAGCMAFSDVIHVMLLTHDKFRQFTPRPMSVTRDMSGFGSTRSVRFSPEGSHAAGGQDGPDH